MWQAIGYRRLQAITIALLAALITTCVVFAPLYQRAVLQALTQVKLDAAPEPVRGLQLMSRPIGAPDSPGGSGARSADALGSLLPTAVGHAFGHPVSGQTAQAGLRRAEPDHQRGDRRPDVTRRGLRARHDGVRSVSARGTARSRSTQADSRNFALRVGSSVELEARPGAVLQTDPSGRPPPLLRLRVVGVYRAIEGRYWFGAQLTGFSGTMAPNNPVMHDPWLTAPTTFGALETKDSDTAPLPSSTVDYYSLDVTTRVSTRC